MWETRLLEPRRPPRQLAGRGDLRRHVREGELDRLELRDPLPELLALERVRPGRVECRLRDAHRLRGDPDPAAVERRHGDREALSLLVQEPVAVDEDVAGESEVGRGRGVQPELLLLAGHLDVLGAEEERGDAAGASRFRVRPREEEEGRGVAPVRAPLLRPADAPAVPVGDRRRPQRAGIRA